MIRIIGPPIGPAAANAATNRHDFLVALEQAEKHQAALAREEEALLKATTGENGGSSKGSPLGLGLR